MSGLWWRGSQLEYSARCWSDVSAPTDRNPRVPRRIDRSGVSRVPTVSSNQESEALPEPLDREAITKTADVNDADPPAANGTSIAFIFEYGGRRVLFGADAHSSILTAALAGYAQRIGETRPRIDFVKLAHLGSNATLSTAMLAADGLPAIPHRDQRQQPCPSPRRCNRQGRRVGPTGHLLLQPPNGAHDPWEEQGPGVGATFAFPKGKRRSLRMTA